MKYIRANRLANSFRRTQGFDRSLEQSLDSIQAKVKWVGRDRADVQEWLAANGLVDRAVL